MKAIEKVIEIEKHNKIDVPYFVWHLLSDQCKEIHISGIDNISLGEDYVHASEIRRAMDWYVEQFGGKVKWKKI